METIYRSCARASRPKVWYSIYLDPPFNGTLPTMSFSKPATSGDRSAAQIEAFEDTWHWNESAELAFDEVMRSGNTQAANMLRAIRSFLGVNDMMAYLAMMAVRLIELHRVLKRTGSLYLHCDPTASHYLKIVLDSIFEAKNFRNEIIWKRSIRPQRRPGPPMWRTPFCFTPSRKMLLSTRSFESMTPLTLIGSTVSMTTTGEANTDLGTWQVPIRAQR